MAPFFRKKPTPSGPGPGGKLPKLFRPGLAKVLAAKAAATFLGSRIRKARAEVHDLWRRTQMVHLDDAMDRTVTGLYDKDGPTEKAYKNLGDVWVDAFEKALAGAMAPEQYSSLVRAKVDALVKAMREEKLPEDAINEFMEIFQANLARSQAPGKK